MAGNELPTKIIIWLDTGSAMSDRWINRGAMQQLDTLTKRNKSTDIELHIPSVVNDEMQHHYLSRYESVLNTLENANDKLAELGLNQIMINKYDENDLIQTFNNELSQYNLSVIKTDLSKYKTEDIYNLAIRHKLPFQDRGDKGFKDYLIANTVFDHVATQAKNTRSFFVTGDRILSLYVEEQGFEQIQLKVVSDIKELLNDVGLAADSLNERLAVKASELFRDSFIAVKLDDPNSVFNKIKIDYDHYFPDASFARKHVSQLMRPAFGALTSYEIDEWKTGTDRFNVSSADFIGRRNATLHWQSKVTYSHSYEIEPISSTISFYQITHEVVYIIDWQTHYETGDMSNPLFQDLKHDSEKAILTKEPIMKTLTLNGSSNPLSIDSYNSNSTALTLLSGKTPLISDIGSSRLSINPQPNSLQHLLRRDLPQVKPFWIN